MKDAGLLTKNEIDLIASEKGKYDLDEVQNHFLYSNEPLINGIPMSVFFKLEEKKNENK